MSLNTTVHPLQPPSHNEVITAILPALQKNFAHASATSTACPDLRQPPYHLAARGLCGSECVADIGGQPNLFPRPNLDAKYDLLAVANEMKLGPKSGMLLGAGAGPWHVLGTNSELAPNLAWADEYGNVRNETRYVAIDNRDGHKVICEKCESTDCALMMNLYGSEGLPGDVIKIVARQRKGKENFTDCIRFALREAFGDDRTVTMGGVFVVTKGRANFHVMPDFPDERDLPFKSREQLNEWLTYHDFDAPIVCLTVFHSADPGQKLGLRMEHTHCFRADGKGGGHYHRDLESDEVEYEAYLNVAKTIYRVDKPTTTLKQDLHD